MLESGGGAPGGEGARLGAPHPTNLEERKSPLAAQITMQVSLMMTIVFIYLKLLLCVSI